jgi:hypothetical protein
VERRDAVVQRLQNDEVNEEVFFLIFTGTHFLQGFGNTTA